MYTIVDERTMIIHVSESLIFIAHRLPAPKKVECQYHTDDLFYVRYDNRLQSCRQVGETGFDCYEDAIRFIDYLSTISYTQYTFKLYTNDYTPILKYQQPTDDDWYIHSYDFSSELLIVPDETYTIQQPHGPFVEEVKYTIVWKNNKPGFNFDICGKTYWVPLNY